MANLSQYPRPTDSKLTKCHTNIQIFICYQVKKQKIKSNSIKSNHVYSPFPNKALELLLSRQLEIEWLQPLAKNACLYDNKKLYYVRKMVTVTYKKKKTSSEISKYFALENVWLSHNNNCWQRDYISIKTNCLKLWRYELWAFLSRSIPLFLFPSFTFSLSL